MAGGCDKSTDVTCTSLSRVRCALCMNTTKRASECNSRTFVQYVAGYHVHDESSTPECSSSNNNTCRKPNGRRKDPIRCCRSTRCGSHRWIPPLPSQREASWIPGDVIPQKLISNSGGYKRDEPPVASCSPRSEACTPLVCLSVFGEVDRCTLWRTYACVGSYLRSIRRTERKGREDERRNALHAVSFI